MVLARLALGMQDAPEGEEPEDRRLREVRIACRLTELLREVDPEVDPAHLAHLPAQSPGKSDIAWAQFISMGEPPEGKAEDLQRLGSAARILERLHREEIPDDEEQP